MTAVSRGRGRRAAPAVPIPGEGSGRVGSGLGPRGPRCVGCPQPLNPPAARGSRTQRERDPEPQKPFPARPGGPRAQLPSPVPQFPLPEAPRAETQNLGELRVRPQPPPHPLVLHPRARMGTAPLERVPQEQRVEGGPPGWGFPSSDHPLLVHGRGCAAAPLLKPCGRCHSLGSVLLLARRCGAVSCSGGALGAFCFQSPFRHSCPPAQGCPRAFGHLTSLPCTPSQRCSLGLGHSWHKVRHCWGTHRTVGPH